MLVSRSVDALDALETELENIVSKLAAGLFDEVSFLMSGLLSAEKGFGGMRSPAIRGMESCSGSVHED